MVKLHVFTSEDSYENLNIIDFNKVKSILVNVLEENIYQK
jgi:hypothetical protein